MYLNKRLNKFFISFIRLINSMKIITTIIIILFFLVLILLLFYRGCHTHNLKSFTKCISFIRLIYSIKTIIIIIIIVFFIIIISSGLPPKL